MGHRNTLWVFKLNKSVDPVHDTYTSIIIDTTIDMIKHRNIIIMLGDPKQSYGTVRESNY